MILVFFRVISIVLVIVGVVLFIDVYKYVKQHGKEELEVHKSYLFPRMIAIPILGTISCVLNLIVTFLSL